MKFHHALVASLSAMALGGCVTTVAPQTDANTDFYLARMLAGESAVSGGELDKALAEAAQHPLGSKKNPVRASRPQGQRAYLSRLRCADLSRPEFTRAGNVGMGPFGNIVDAYVVTCADSEPAERTIHMDMYHAGYVENEAVEGYGITGGKPE
ncbi:hypothetical protein K3163_01675 [Qipengyuania sp. 1NDW9]|uniref:Lipoprotein n=2 Tax=Qipengyuania TaxID=1855416 RepID=A0A9Q3S312_9SPHN|nr:MULTISPECIES: hypothetical protein [Qipengyuania]MBX7491913.1 hypothetical protein [Qipengyuania xiapuensis]MBY6218895.1 hypothetical protein [Qipengyuania aquimaris]QZD91384.1 hypothetical protein K3162_07305 [Qipengyuania xiapuensis]